MMEYGCLLDHTLGQNNDNRNRLTCATSDYQYKNTTRTIGSLLTPNCLSVRCCQSNLCNRIEPTRQPRCLYARTSSQQTSIISNDLTLAIAAPIGLIILLSLIFGIFLIWRRKSKLHQNRDLNLYDARTTLTAVPLEDDSLKGLLEHSMSSGSGSGLPFLVERTIAQQIVLGTLIGKGRYGEVWDGNWQGESVAVKIFNSREEESWKRETEIYTTASLRHDNILGYIAADIATRNGTTCMWLITEYHAHGSLYDYLNQHTLDIQHMCLLAYSTISGLVHLHAEIFGVHNKPAIAHRDIKTKNILVKRNGQCCISDLGLSVLHSSKSNQINMCFNRRAGTKRYMAPEILDETLSETSFDAFKQIDIYAFGLVLWEMSRRTVINGVAADYQPPYYEKLHDDPPFEEVRKVVCDEKYRPVLSQHWHDDKNNVQIARLMRECWHTSPMIRLTGLRVKKTLEQLMRQFQNKI